MKKIIVVLFSLLFCVNIMAQDREIKFKNLKFEEALILAKKQNKLLFVDCYTSWCGPCKMLAKDVFTNNDVADYFNSNFICLKIDCEKGEGPMVRKKFRVMGFPTLLFINGEGKVMNKIVGASSQPMFLKKVKAGLDPKTSLFGKVQRYKKGERDRAFILDLIKSYKAINESKSVKDISIEFLSTLSEKEMFTSEIWDIVKYYYVSTYDSKWWNFIIENSDKYIAIVGEEAFAAKIGETLHPYLFGYIYGRKKAKSMDEFNVLKNLVNKYSPKQEDILYTFIELGKSASFEDFNGYFNTLVRIIPEMPLSEHYRFFSNAFNFLVTNSNDKQKEILRKMLLDSQSRQTEYFVPLYKKFLDKL